MPLPIRLTPLIIIIQSIRPKMPPTTINLSTLPIPRPQQRRRLRPIIRTTLGIKRLRLPHPKRMRNLVQRRALIHVRAVRPETNIPAEAAIGRLHARVVLDGEGLVGALGKTVVAVGGSGDGALDALVGVLLVGRGVGGFADGVGNSRRGGRGVEGRHGEDVETHCGW